MSAIIFVKQIPPWTSIPKGWIETNAWLHLAEWSVADVCITGKSTCSRSRAALTNPNFTGLVSFVFGCLVMECALFSWAIALEWSTLRLRWERRRLFSLTGTCRFVFLFHVWVNICRLWVWHDNDGREEGGRLPSYSGYMSTRATSFVSWFSTCGAGILRSMILWVVWVVVQIDPWNPCGQSSAIFQSLTVFRNIFDWDRIVC